eukprot:s176_g29.t1
MGGGHGRAMGKRDADSDEDDGGKKPRLSGLGAFGGLGFSNSAPPPDHGSPEMQFDQLLGASFLPAVPGGNLGPIADIDPLKPATTPMDFSRLGTSLPSQDFPVPRDMVEYLMTPEHRQIILEVLLKSPKANNPAKEKKISPNPRKLCARNAQASGQKLTS